MQGSISIVVRSYTEESLRQSKSSELRGTVRLAGGRSWFGSGILRFRSGRLRFCGGKSSFRGEGTPSRGGDCLVERVSARFCGHNVLVVRDLGILRGFLAVVGGVSGIVGQREREEAFHIRLVSCLGVRATCRRFDLDETGLRGESGLAAESGDKSRALQKEVTPFQGLWCSDIRCFQGVALRCRVARRWRWLMHFNCIRVAKPGSVLAGLSNTDTTE